MPTGQAIPNPFLELAALHIIPYKAEIHVHGYRNIQFAQPLRRLSCTMHARLQGLGILGILQAANGFLSLPASFPQTVKAQLNLTVLFSVSIYNLYEISSNCYIPTSWKVLLQEGSSKLQRAQDAQMWETTENQHATTKFQTSNNIFFKRVTHPNNTPTQPKPKNQTKHKPEALVPANQKTTTNKNKQNQTRKPQLGQEKNQLVHVRGDNGKATWLHGVSIMEQRFPQISNAPY